MSSLIRSTTKSPRFWMATVFFLLPLIASGVLDSGAEGLDTKLVSAEACTAAEAPWTPFPMDATTDGTLIVRKVAYPRDTSQMFNFTGDVSGTIPSGGTLTVTDVPLAGRTFRFYCLVASITVYPSVSGVHSTRAGSAHSAR